MILAFDVETTGKADFRSPPNAQYQPRIVQLAALLIDDDWTEAAHFNLIIKPAGFKIPDEAAAIHGITTEIAERRGVSIRRALDLFLGFCHAPIKVAHNIAFDSFLIEGELMRSYGNFSPQILEEQFCTMKAMTPICKLPNQYGYSDFKWPKLQEAHKFAFGVEFDGAHDALADVRADLRIYRWLKERKDIAV